MCWYKGLWYLWHESFTIGTIDCMYSNSIGVPQTMADKKTVTHCFMVWWLRNTGTGTVQPPHWLDLTCPWGCHLWMGSTGSSSRNRGSTWLHFQHTHKALSRSNCKLHLKNLSHECTSLGWSFLLSVIKSCDCNGMPPSPIATLKRSQQDHSVVIYFI